MHRTPQKHFRPWTTEEVKTLERMLAEGVPMRNFAKHLGRTRSAVDNKAYALKASLKSQPDPSS
jgi:hypothetical protein